MAVSYEDALETLQAMFGEPWNRQTLDAVLRHEKGHMENACELILQHGEKDPQILVNRLKACGPEPQVAMDEELARQLAASSSNINIDHTCTNDNDGGPKNKGRGIPTSLPDAFLRLPGYRQSSVARTSANSNNTANNSGGQQAIDDETLARMLQDELFSEELARNPDFAHLAGQRRSQQRESSRVSASTVRLPAAQPGAPLQNPFEGAKVMQKISSMGDGARRKLQLFANNFENKMKGINNPNNVSSAGTTGLQEARGAAAERRGLLDDDDYYGDDMIEFETRKSK